MSLKTLTLVRHRDNVTANKLQCSRERGIWTARKHTASSHGANAQKWLLDEVKTFLCLLSMRGSQTDRTSSVGQALLSRAEPSHTKLWEHGNKIILRLTCVTMETMRVSSRIQVRGLASTEISYITRQREKEDSEY